MCVAVAQICRKRSVRLSDVGTLKVYSCRGKANAKVKRMKERTIRKDERKNFKHQCIILLSHSLSIGVNGPLGPVDTERSVNAVTTLAILLSLKTMESLQIGLQPYSGVTLVFNQSSITNIITAFTLMISVKELIHSERMRKRNVLWIFIAHWIVKILTRGQWCFNIHFHST